MNNYIKEIQDSGKLIVLDDGSKWAVGSYDSFTTRIWLRMDKITVANNELINTSRRNEKVPATRSR